MALGDKPSTQPAWNTGLANQTEPGAAKKTLGWVPGESNIASSAFNWLFFTLYEWTRWLASYTDTSTGHVHDGGSNTTGSSPSAPKVAFPNVDTGEDHIDMGVNGAILLINDDASLYALDISHTGAGSAGVSSDTFTAIVGVETPALWNGSGVAVYTNAGLGTFAPVTASELRTTGGTVRSTTGATVEFVNNVGARVDVEVENADVDGTITLGASGALFDAAFAPFAAALITPTATAGIYNAQKGFDTGTAIVTTTATTTISNDTTRVTLTLDSALSATSNAVVHATLRSPLDVTTRLLAARAQTTTTIVIDVTRLANGDGAGDNVDYDTHVAPSGANVGSISVTVLDLGRT